jgi:flagella basal body P-ring formation protein FlgA
MMILLATLALSGIPTVQVELPMEAHVQGTEIELGEVAKVLGTDADAVRLVESIELGYAPAPGYSRLLHAERIRQLLVAKAPQVEVRMTGQRATRVWPEVAEVSAADVQKTALDELRRVYATSDARFEVAGTLPRIVIPVGTGAPTLRARVDERKLSSGTISVPVEVQVDGAMYRTVWTSWTTEVYQTLPVLVREVKAGTVLSRDLFENRRVLVSSGTRTKPLAPSRLPGSVAAHDLAAGTIITGTDVHRPAVVNQGDSLFLCVKKGNIEAKVPAVALGAGAIGDRIRVRTTGRGQELTAEIRSRDIAVIDLSR